MKDKTEERFIGSHASTEIIMIMAGANSGTR